MIVALAGCGRWGYDEIGMGDDAGSGIDSSGPDAAVPVCTSGDFGTPELVTGLGLPPSVYGPSVTADGTGLYFSHVTGGEATEDLYFSSRSAAGASFAAAVSLEINSAFQDGTPFITHAGTELFFSSSRTGSRDIWLATRPTASAELTVERDVAELNSAAIDHRPTLTWDGGTVIFASGRAGGGDENLYLAERPSIGASFGAVAAIDELNTSDYETSPFVTGDGMTVYFMSNRPNGAGCDDIWMATRPAPTLPFDPAEPVPGINSVACDDDPSLSADGCEIFFASNRSGDGYRLYRATRSP
jgi:Tol biopolymer transport system component